FRIQVYRMGWYGGKGARRMEWMDGDRLTQVTVDAVTQEVPTPDPTTNVVECRWTPSYVLKVPEDWVSGVYVAKLSTVPLETSRETYIIFVVREDDRSADLVFQSSVTTFQAYNPWGGSSVYPFPCSPTVPCSTKVSFNRPY